MSKNAQPNGAPQSSVDFHQVCQDEREAIKERRVAAGCDSYDSDCQPGNDLVGLALSGGGLRSAMFNLGFLQALQEAGFMKFVDYLSTVSGGGYVGGFYSAIGHNYSHARGAALPTSHQGQPSDTGTEVRPHDEDRHHVPQLTHATHRFINAGQYLNQPWPFLAGYLLPSLAVFLLFFSSLVAVASTIALFLRCFDLPTVQDHLQLMGLDSELSYLFVSIVSLWAFLMIVHLAGRLVFRDRHASSEGKRAANRGIGLKLAAIAIMCGLAIMIGNYDLRLLNSSIHFKQDYHIPLAILAFLGALGLFRLPLLLRSEQVTASLWQKAILWLVLSAAVGGSSLAVLTYLGSEGISGYASQRGPQLDHEDIVDFRAFSDWLTARSKISNLNSLFAADKLAPTLEELSRGFTVEVNDLEQQRRELFPDTLTWRGNPWSMLHFDDFSRFFRYILSAFEGDEHNIRKYLRQTHQLRKSRDTIVDRINDAIFPDVAKPDIPLNQAQTNYLLRQLEERIGLSAPLSRRTTDSEAPKKSNPVDVHTHLVKYLDAQTGHTDRPLLGTDRFLKTLAPMIEPDGSLRYRKGELEKQAELQFRRQLLEVLYPNVFKQLQFVSSSVVVGKDQEARLWILLFSTLLFIVLFLYVDFNHHAAVYRFYRERIARTFIEAGGRDRHDADMPLSRLSPWKQGFPYPLISAALRLPQSVDINQLTLRTLEDNPAKVDGSVGSEWYSFLLSPKYVGYMMANSGGEQKPPHHATRKTYRPTDFYLSNELKLSDAVTLSGAAFTPWMSNTLSLNFLMHVFNLRLEQWLPNPELEVSLLPKQPVNLWRIWRERLRCSTREGLKKWQWGVVADGGFREFLGVEELIARRCRIIVVADAGCNNGISEFGVLADLIRQIRLDHGVRILDLDHDLPLDTDRMKRMPDGRGVQHFIVGRIRYPDTDVLDSGKSLYERTGLLVYVQMSLTGDEDVDLAQFQKVHPTFPDEPITNQFFTADQVESLRQLGQHVGRHLCQRLHPEAVNNPIAENEIDLKGIIRSVVKELDAENEVKDLDTGLVKHNNSNGDKASRNATYLDAFEQVILEIRRDKGWKGPKRKTIESRDEKLLRLIERKKDEAIRDIKREAAIECLADALVGAYLMECRQEVLVDKDDTPPDMPVISGRIDFDAVDALRRFEERGELGRRLSHFVTCVVDGYCTEDAPASLASSPRIGKLAREIRPEDLTGLAVECNRRHVGFRTENPSRYFRIGGRRLLLRSTSRAIDTYKKIQARQAFDWGPEEKVNFEANFLPELIHAVARLAAIVPDGIFRQNGVETARELTLCVITWLSQNIAVESLNTNWLNKASFRRGLELAIRTKLTSEIYEYLERVLLKNVSASQAISEQFPVGRVEPMTVLMLQSNDPPNSVVR